jgi:hypothetical protein
MHLQMKKVYSLLLMLVIFISSSAQTDAAATDVVQLKEAEFDFGKVPQGKPVYHTFEITNKSSQPLKLDNVTASCGCTTPEWSKEPIAPGATSKIKVGFNAAAEGAFEKYITVQYNQNATKQIKIKGLVWRTPTSAAPANASVQFLKQQIQ